MRTAALIALLVVLVPIGLLVGALAGFAIVAVQRAVLNRRFLATTRRLVSDRAPVDAVVSGYTPPIEGAQLRRAVMLTIFPGILLGPFAVFLFWWLTGRGQSRRLVAVGREKMWLLATEPRSWRPSAVIAEAFVTPQNPVVSGRSLVCDFGTEKVDTGRFSRSVFSR